MDIIRHSFSPVEQLAEIFTGRRLDTKQEAFIRGLAGDANCIPFYQISGQIVDASKVSSMASVWPAVWKSLSGSVSAYGISAGMIFSLASSLDKIINAAYYKTLYVKSLQQSYDAKRQRLQWALDCHMPYCSTIDDLTNIDFDSQFYNKAMQQNLMDNFLIITILYNNDRIQTSKHIQTILAVQMQTAENFSGLEYMGFGTGNIMIRVPNIEAYWLWEQIKISGCGDTLFTVKQRYGQTKGNIQVSTQYGERNSPYYLGAGNNSKSTYGVYKSEGYSIENLYGEGWLFLDKPLSSYPNLKAGTSQVSLKNTALVPVPTGAAKTPKPATAPKPAPTPSPTPTPITTTNTNLLQIPNTWLTKLGIKSSFGTLAGQLLLVGIGVTLMYEAFDEKPSSSETFKSTNNQ